MKRRSITRLWAIAGAATLLLALACTNTDDLRTEAHTVQPEAATSARVSVRMGAGKLRLDGGASELARAAFTYNVTKWKPVVDYTVTNCMGTLTIEQPSS